MFHEGLKIKGRVRVRVFDVKTGKLLEEQIIRNVFTIPGKQTVAGFLAGESVNPMTYIAVGSGTTTPTESDTALESEIGRKVFTERYRDGNKAYITAFFGSGDANGTWNEVGIFDQASGGIMFARTLFNTPISKDTSKTVAIDWEVTVN